MNLIFKLSIDLWASSAYYAALLCEAEGNILSSCLGHISDSATIINKSVHKHAFIGPRGKHHCVVLFFQLNVYVEYM